ncbi:MAG TPA: RDD family protein [Candidatus Limnocylindria bacterium]
MTNPTSTSWQAPAPPPPGPAPGYVFGDFAPRLVAYLIDVVIVIGAVIAVVVAWALLAAASGGIGADYLSGGAAGGLVFVLAIAIPLITIGYFPWFWARSGATPGMRSQGLKVVRDADGGPISTGQALLRLIGYWISGAVFYLGYIWILVDKRRRGWHDLIAGTVVIKEA